MRSCALKGQQILLCNSAAVEKRGDFRDVNLNQLLVLYQMADL